MKVPPTPTSPKTQSAARQELDSLLRDGSLRQLTRPSRPPRLSVLTLFFSMIIGFVAGMLGELVLNAYLIDQSGLPVVTPNAPREKTAIQVADALLSTNKAVLTITPLTPFSGTAADAVSPAATVGAAILLTDDGWAVSSSAVLKDDQSYAAVTADRRVLEVKHRLRDPASDLVFFQIDGGNYPVAPLADSVPETERLFALAGSGRQTVTRSVAVAIEQRSARRGILESSDRFTRFWVLDSSVPSAFSGGPVVDGRGRVGGVIVDAGASSEGAVVLPSRAISRVLQTLFRERKLRRPALGIHSIDLGATAGVPSALRYGRAAGAFVTGTPEQPAIQEGSPAAGAGVRSGDIILRVGDQLLTELVGLSDVIQEYQPGAVVNVILLRDGKEQEVRLTLDEQVPT